MFGIFHLISICVLQVHDLIWIRKVDPATIGYLQPLLYFKGFHAIQVQRLTHVLWATNNLRKKMTALSLQSRVAEVFGVDAHPGARISHSVMLDHASGVVIGETASIGHSCYILHGVTLGATGKSSSFDRHPKVRNNVKIGAGAMILGNIALEDGVVVGAGAVVTLPVPKVLPGDPACLGSLPVFCRARTHAWLLAGGSGGWGESDSGGYAEKGRA